MSRCEEGKEQMLFDKGVCAKCLEKREKKCEHVRRDIEGVCWACGDRR